MKRGNCNRILKVNINLDLRLDVNQGVSLKKNFSFQKLLKREDFRAGGAPPTYPAHTQVHSLDEKLDPTARLEQHIMVIPRCQGQKIDLWILKLDPQFFPCSFHSNKRPAPTLGFSTGCSDKQEGFCVPDPSQPPGRQF